MKTQIKELPERPQSAKSFVLCAQALSLIKIKVREKTCRGV